MAAIGEEEVSDIDFYIGLSRVRGFDLEIRNVCLRTREGIVEARLALKIVLVLLLPP